MLMGLMVVIVSRRRSARGSGIVIAVIATGVVDTVMKTRTDTVHVDTGLGLHRRTIVVHIGVGGMIGTIVMIVTGGAETAETVTGAKTVDVADLETDMTAKIMTAVLRADTGTVMIDTTTALVATRIVDVHPLLVGTVVHLLTGEAQKATATASLETTTTARVTPIAVTVTIAIPSPRLPTVTLMATPTTPNLKSNKKKNASANLPKCNPMLPISRRPVVNASTKSRPWKSASARRTREIVLRRVGLSDSCTASYKRIVLIKGSRGVVEGWLLIRKSSCVCGFSMRLHGLSWALWAAGLISCTTKYPLVFSGVRVISTTNASFTYLQIRPSI